MNQSFVAAMSRAYAAARAVDTAGATAIIQDSLKGALPPATGVATSAGLRPRRSIAETIAALKQGASALRRESVLTHGTNELEIVAGARFEDGHFANSAGRRNYRLYVPASASDRPRGLVVMLHGCTQNPVDFAIGTGMNGLAESNGLLILYPEQASRHNSMSCWQWFSPSDQHRDLGEPSILAGMTESISNAHSIGNERCFVAGLSAGGAMAAILTQAYPDRFAACGVHSGLAPGLASDVASAFAVMRGDFTQSAVAKQCGTPLILFHGTADATVAQANADHLVEWAANIASPAIIDNGRSADGTRYSRSRQFDANGCLTLEDWRIEGLGHAWSGGNPRGSYTAAGGPDASAEMVRFFLNLSN